MLEFQEFPKIQRWNQGLLITEKIDGTNGCVVVGQDGEIGAQSRNRLLTPENDNFDFSKWVQKNAEELRQLGPGYHYGEWWGAGIGRRYNLFTERRFSLFDAQRWADRNNAVQVNELKDKEGVQWAPACCRVVPVLYRSGCFDNVDDAMELLKVCGSRAEAGYMNPEGVVIYHYASRQRFKCTYDGPKWQARTPS